MTQRSYLDGFRAILREHGWHASVTPSELLARWDGLVEACEAGYGWTSYEHSNELSARDLLEAVFADPRTATAVETKELRRQVSQLDARYRALLREDVHVGDADDPWWRRGVLRQAGPDYVDDMQRAHGITVERA